MNYIDGLVRQLENFLFYQLLEGIYLHSDRPGKVTYHDPIPLGESHAASRLPIRYGNQAHA